MFSLYLSVLFLVAECLAVPATEGVSFDKRAGELPTLTLPYATYRAASYNPNGDVLRLLAQKMGEVKADLSLVLCIQEHSLCCAASWTTTVCKACASSPRARNSEWLLRTHLQSRNAVIVSRCLCSSCFIKAYFRR